MKAYTINESGKSKMIKFYGLSSDDLSSLGFCVKEADKILKSYNKSGLDIYQEMTSKGILILEKTDFTFDFEYLTPIEHLHSVARSYPTLINQVNELVVKKEIDEWPSWCFLPIEKFLKLTKNIFDFPIVAAITTWRYTQGIYKIDPTVFDELKETPLEGDLPVDVLLNLPEWCLYVETPGLNFFDDPIFGFWIHLDYDTKTHEKSLRMILHSVTIYPLIVELNHSSLLDCLKKTYKENQTDIKKIFDVKAFETLVSIIIFLCQKEPDISGITEPKGSPGNSYPRKTKKGLKIFPAERPRFWNVGKTIGESIRDTQSYDNHHEGMVRPHLRRAHWHGFWTGSRQSDERKYIIKWLAPTFVGNVKDR